MQDFSSALNATYNRRWSPGTQLLWRGTTIAVRGGGTSPQAILNIKDVAEFEDNWGILPDYQVDDGLA